MPNELQENGFISDAGNTSAGLAEFTTIYILRGGYSEAGFRDFLAGNNPSYAYGDSVFPGISGASYGAVLLDTISIYDQLFSAGINATTAKLDIVVVQSNTFSNGVGNSNGDTRDADYTLGFFEAFHFEAGAKRAYPLRLGVA